jgi:hypothetical protein
VFARFKHAWQLAYAVAIVYLHGFLLNGPMLLGPRAFGMKLFAAGLGAYAGTALADGLLKASARKGTKREAIVASTMIAVFGLLAAAYRLSIVILSLLMRAFLASLMASREIQGRTKGGSAEGD